MAAPVIAVVDDNLETLEMMGLMLADAGYRTMLLPDGMDVYQRIREAQPDLVILDLRMGHPREGWINVDLLRADPATSKLPIILCSGDRAFLQERAEQLRARRCNILEKPFHAYKLLAQVRQALESRPDE